MTGFSIRCVGSGRIWRYDDEETYLAAERWAARQTNSALQEWGRQRCVPIRRPDGSMDPEWFEAVLWWYTQFGP